MKKTLPSLLTLALLLQNAPTVGQETQVSQETQPATQPTAPEPVKELESLGEMPEFQGIDQWLNSAPLTKAQLKGKVVLVDFWTYSCVNCIRTLPVLKDWYKKYKNRGLVIIGVHSPEFEFERDPTHVKMAIDKYQIPYPVALDNKMQTWTAFRNNAWPAHYFIDRQGKIRHIHLGEGDYDKSEKILQNLLMETAGPPAETQPTKLPPLSTISANVDFSQIKSPETYLGLLRRERLVTSGRPIEMNEWMYDGKWRTEGERILLTEGTGKISFRFNATKVNLVLHPTGGGVQAVVRLDGQVVPAQKAGADVKNGTLMVTEPRMYELINLGSKGEEHTVEIEFLTPGVAAYAFTFG